MRLRCGHGALSPCFSGPTPRQSGAATVSHARRALTQSASIPSIAMVVGMEEFIKALVQQLGPTVSSFLGVGALALVVLPNIVKAWDSWSDTRSGQRAFRAERARLELLKLWIEVEALKKEHNLQPPFPLQPHPPATVGPSPQSHVDAMHGQSGGPAGTETKQPRMWRWLSALNRLHHAVATVALGLLAVIFLLTAGFGVLWITVGVSLIHSTTSALLVLISTVLELLLLLNLRSLFRQYKLLRTASQNVVTAEDTRKI
jgi:hypothetical protein